ncbi:MAG TPA: vWA domain-containing protein [Nitrosopumilaceae archaeon]|nr:vWA domain-containing protein [Nitrosopumilaceae archaeon]
MKKTLFEISNGIFYEIAQSTINQVGFNTSDKIEFPIIENTSRCRVTIPKPRKVDDVYFFEGCIFDSYDDHFETIWSLYLATISQMAAHVKISDFSKYKHWVENKTPEKCWRVIDFVENARVEEYLKISFPDVWEHLMMVKTTYNKLVDDKILKHTNEKFYNSFCVKKADEITQLREKISQIFELQIKEIIPHLDFLYKNQELLSKNILPYCIHRSSGFSYKCWNKNVKIQPIGRFEDIILEIDNVWNKEINKNDRLDEYQNFAEDSHFDEVIIGSENLAEFSRLSNESAGLLQRLRTSIRTLSNIVDTPAAEDVGIIEMQMAIQREASKNQDIQIFEQDIPRKESESWVVVIDASASMISKFEEMKKMALCLSEAAESINQTGGKWGLYSFNNNFIIVKDHVEHYNQETKARIGGIENKGLSLIPDAINMGVKILKKDKESTHKYLILISDGHALGYNNIDEDFKKSLLNAKRDSVNVIGIGVPKSMSRYFSFIINCDDPNRSVDKFMSAYSYLTQTMK